MSLEINTSIIIKTTPQHLWKVFTSFDAYKDWNPFISLEGKVAVGNTIKANIDGSTFKPTVLVFEEYKLEWLGKLIISGIFDGNHKFEIIDNLDGTCTFKQNEMFKGILVPLLAKKLNTEIRSGFEKMNTALKQRAEKPMLINL